jgi:hypothetical protein
MMSDLRYGGGIAVLANSITSAYELTEVASGGSD